MLTKTDLDRLQKRLERWNRHGNPISVNHGLELVALARKGLETERLEKEVSWLAEHLGKVGSNRVENMCPQWDEIVERCLARFGTCSNCWREAARQAVAKNYD